VLADEPYQLPGFKVQMLPCFCYMFSPGGAFVEGRPRYLTVSVCGMVDWLMYNGGQVPFRRVNVIHLR